MDDHDDQRIHQKVECDGISGNEVDSCSGEETIPSSVEVDSGPVRRSIPEDFQEAKPALPRLKGNCNSEDYSLNYSSKGKCYIFNHQNFKNLETRYGTDYDASSLQCQFESLGFEVERFNDLTVLQIIDKLNKVAGDEKHWNRSCFVCCILTHGDNGMLSAYNGKYSIESVFTPFRGDNCPALLGKPKLFFIQAQEIATRGPSAKATFFDCDDEGEDSLKIPVASDFLVAYSTSPGYTSWKPDNCGSWFIQALCSVLKLYASSMDLLQMLTIANRKVALESETFCFDYSDEEMKHAPYFTSTLLRSVKFCEF